MEELVIAGSNGKDVTTSLIVAKVFGKEHNKVCRDIESLSCSDGFRVANFGETQYVHPQNGQTYKMYEITKDGFSFLVMGYTGYKAGLFKEKFIFEFNRRESMLNSDDYILARSQEILRNRLTLAEQQLQIAQGTIEVQQEEIKQLAPKAQYTDEVLQSTSTFTFTQIAKSFGFRSVHTLISFLKDKGIIYKQSGQWMPVSRYSDKGYFKTRTARYFHKDGTPDTSLSTVITEYGRVFLWNLLSKHGELNSTMPTFKTEAGIK